MASVVAFHLTFAGGIAARTGRWFVVVAPRNSSWVVLMEFFSLLIWDNDWDTIFIGGEHKGLGLNLQCLHGGCPFGTG